MQTNSESLELCLWKHIDLTILKIDNLQSWVSALRYDYHVCDNCPAQQIEAHWAYFLDSLNLLRLTVHDCPVEDIWNLDDQEHAVLKIKNSEDVKECRMFKTPPETSGQIANSVYQTNSDIASIVGNCLRYLASQSRCRMDVITETDKLLEIRSALVDIRDRLEALPKTQISLQLEGAQVIVNTLQLHKTHQLTNSKDEYSELETQTTDVKAEPIIHEILLIVSQNPPQVTLNGKTENVSPEGARLVQLAIDKQGEYFNPANYEILKPSRVKEAMPLAIRELFDSSPGKGTRIPFQMLYQLGCIKQK